MNAQEIFNKVATAVLAQGRGSTKVGAKLMHAGKPNTFCAYRSLCGACAVGHLIDDELANEWDAETDPSISNLLNDEDNKYTEDPRVPAYFFRHIDLLEHLQHAHDTAALTQRGIDQVASPPERFMEIYLRKMRWVAERFNLNPAVLEAPNAT